MSLCRKRKLKKRNCIADSGKNFMGLKGPAQGEWFAEAPVKTDRGSVGGGIPLFGIDPKNGRNLGKGDLVRKD